MTKERAIELLQNFNLYDEPNCIGYWDCDECVEALYMGIEAIQQMPKRGKWIDREEVQDYIKVKHRICSVCYREPSAWSSRKKFKYCPNCGARMEVEQ